ncbi:hypothetical protein B0H10DRAFT_2236467 [Mycena sp. CBHHK59/15]|nr:hypothetical protein B0H10DRAFT_2236467 [Mycena sp. CBHHK59/15]
MTNMDGSDALDEYSYSGNLSSRSSTPGESYHHPPPLYMTDPSSSSMSQGSDDFPGLPQRNQALIPLILLPPDSALASPRRYHATRLCACVPSMPRGSPQPTHTTTHTTIEVPRRHARPRATNHLTDPFRNGPRVHTDFFIPPPPSTLRPRPVLRRARVEMANAASKHTPADREYIGSLSPHILMEFRDYLFNPTYITINAAKFLDYEWIDVHTLLYT